MTSAKPIFSSLFTFPNLLKEVAGVTPETTWRAKIASMRVTASSLLMSPFRTNDAIAVRFSFTVKVHVSFPVQAPDQPVKLEPAAGFAVNVTAVPLG